MCNFKEELKVTQKTGFKVSIKMNGKYYSPATGIEYKPGMVTIPKVQNRLTCNLSSDILKKDGCIFLEILRI